MLKFFERGPFAKWSFLQKAIQRHRIRRRSRSGGFKTFDTQFRPTKDDLLFDNEDSDAELNEPANGNHSQNILSTKSNPFPKLSYSEYNQASKKKVHIKRASSLKSRDDVERVAAEYSELPTVNGIPEQLNKPTSASAANGIPGGENKLMSLRIKQTASRLESEDVDGLAGGTLETKGSLRRAYSDEKIHWSDEEAAAISVPKQSANEAAFSSFDFRRSSKVRRSLRELRQKSVDHVEAVKEKIVRRVNALKYSNMDAQDEDSSDGEQEIVTYERSPGSKRRQVSTALRRSFRSTGKYVRAAMSQNPSLSMGLGLAAASGTQSLTTTV